MQRAFIVKLDVEDDEDLDVILRELTDTIRYEFGDDNVEVTLWDSPSTSNFPIL